MKPNTEQQAAIDYDGNLLIIAPPGSGKTATLVSKIARILTQSSKHRVCAVTFTDRAASELKERLQKALTPEAFKRADAKTFHKHCMNQLRQADKLGQLIGPEVSDQLVNHAMWSSNYAGSFEEARAEVEDAKLSPGFTGTETPLIIGYEEQRTARRAIDLWDVLREAFVGMKDQSVAPVNATHLVVDEFQDTDRLQLEWVCHHASLGTISTVVGDDDQSIYGFRKAIGFAGMQEYRERVNAAQIVFSDNYRSHEEILLAASSVIRNNVDRVPKTMQAVRGAGGGVDYLQFSDELSEATYIANLIEKDCTEMPGGAKLVPPKSWAVIARNNANFFVISAALRARRIVYFRAGRDKVNDASLLLCQFLAGLQSADGFVMPLMLRGAGITNDAEAVLSRHVGTNWTPFYEGDAGNAQDFQLDDRKLIHGLSKLCKVWRRLDRTGDAAEQDEVIDGVVLWFLDHIAKGDKERQALRHYSTMLQRARGSLKQRAQLLLNPPKTAEEGEGVQLLTMHSSKGLEFNRVAMIECNQGVIPSPKSESMAEERRLFFVAQTRAKDHLMVCADMSAGPSDFIREMEPALEALEEARSLERAGGRL